MAAVSSGTAKVTLPSDTQILITREFAAPRHLVYEAFTNPELVRRWWHAKRGEMTVCEIDLRVGGKWRYAMDVEGFGEVGFHGEYREIVPNERIVSTEAYEGIPDADEHAAVNILTLTDLGDGRTLLEILVEHPHEGRPGRTRRVRDGGRLAGRPRPARGGRRLAPLELGRRDAMEGPAADPGAFPCRACACRRSSAELDDRLEAAVHETLAVERHRILRRVAAGGLPSPSTSPRPESPCRATRSTRRRPSRRPPPSRHDESR